MLVKDVEWSEFLLRIGDDREIKDSNECITLPECCPTVANANEMINGIFTTGNDLEIDPTTFNNRAILAPKNEDVDDINAKIVSRMDGENVQYRSIYSAENEGDFVYPTEFLNSQNFGGLPPHLLNL